MKLAAIWLDTSEILHSSFLMQPFLLWDFYWIKMLWIWLCSSVKKQELLCYTVLYWRSAWFQLSLQYFMDSDAGGFNPTSVRKQLCGAGLRQRVVCICQFIFSHWSLANLIMDPKHPKKEGSAPLALAAMYSGVKVVPGSNSSWPKLPT